MPEWEARSYINGERIAMASIRSVEHPMGLLLWQVRSCLGKLHSYTQDAHFSINFLDRICDSGVGMRE